MFSGNVRRYGSVEQKDLRVQQSVLYDIGTSNPISIHISISQPSGWQFETAEGARSVRQTMKVGKGEGGINERGFTEKSRRGRGEADDAGDVRAKEES